MRLQVPRIRVSKPLLLAGAILALIVAACYHVADTGGRAARFVENIMRSAW